MKKILILLVVLAALVGIAVYKSSERNSRLNRAVGAVKMREMLFPEFDINGIKKVHVKEDKSEVTLAVQNGTWVIVERGGYPLSKEKLQTALMSLKYEKVKAGRRVGKDSWGKIGVKSPGEANAAGAGTLVELFDDKGNVKHSLILGGRVSSSGGSNDDPMSMFGGGATGNRFVRLKDEDTIWEIGDQLPDLVTKPDAWLDKSFIDVQKIKSIEVTAAKPEDSWKASRPDTETTGFTLEGAKPDENIDSAKANLATVLSSPTFNDVLAKEKAAELMKDPVKVKIVTFDGFTYNLQVAKKKEGEADKYYLTLAVSADLPKERPPVKDEKEEDKKKNDEAFAAEKKKLEEKLAAEKAYEGWVYEVSEYTVSTLLKKRAEILADPAKPEAAAGAASTAPSIPGMSGRPAGLPDVSKMIPGLNPQVESSTPAALTDPPPAVPSAPKPELKPAPTDTPPAPVSPSAPLAPTPSSAAPAAAPASPPAAPAPATPASTPAPAEPAKPAPAEGEKK